MRHHFLPPTAVLLGVALFSGCGRSDDAVEKALRKTVEKNLRACQEEELSALRETVDEAAWENVRTVMQQVFLRYDLAYTLTDFKVLSQEKDSARVEVSQEVRRLRGEAFPDRRVTLVHTLIRTAGKWRISATEIIRYEPL